MLGEAERTDKNWCSIHNTNNITAATNRTNRGTHAYSPTI
jgi:hypothetical protein